ncbi:MAG: type II secretion system major pseudopilin GspG [Alphaproteobacteria bacterium]|nr:type II secretion system major pseudopilin GspG [Alphaproteobacteria bacterium]
MPGSGAQTARGRRASPEAGFTLVELLVVMVILVLLAGLVAPRVINYLGSSRSKAAQVQIESLKTSLELFYLDVGRYPSTAEGLDGLVAKPSGVSRWSGPYLNKPQVPKTPWGHDYNYRSPGQHGAFDLYSLGRDNQEGGSGEDADITSW